MEKLELKHIVGYLPYGLKVYACYDEYILELEEDPSQGDTISVMEMIDNGHKPILRPLSDLTKEIEVNGEKFVPIKIIKTMYPADTFSSTSNVAQWSHRVIEKLYEWHFDIHNLIEAGLAISYNDI